MSTQKAIPWIALLYFALLAALAVAIAPNIAYAEDGGGMWLPRPADALYEDAVIDEGPPKGVVGADGIACHGEASQDGHSLKYTNYVGADADRMSADPQGERAWQAAHCSWLLAEGMSGWFRYQHGVELDVTRIRMTIRRL